jgi:hypothetical protein
MAGMMEAYWQLSAKRFVDNCCMQCDKGLLSELPELLQDQMYHFIRDDHKLQQFFAENPELMKHKTELEQRKTRLLEASGRLASIQVSATPSSR